MTALKLAATSALAIALAACGEPADDTVQTPYAGEATETTEPLTLGLATLQLADGTEAGTTQIESADGVITLNADLQNITPGTHGFHLHTVGTCDAPDFKSAEGHLNPLDKNHGKLSEGGEHVGDLPNVEIADNGTGSITATIEGDVEQVREWLYDADGTAVMVHEGPDDYQTDPSGDAGARVACGVLTQP